MRTKTILSVKNLGVKKTLDLEVNHPDHNFYAEGLVTSNSHSVAYSALSAETLYFKFNHPVEFHTALLNMAVEGSDTHVKISRIVNDLPYFGIKLLPPDLRKPNIDFTVEGGNIRYGFKAMRNLKGDAFEAVMKVCEHTFDNKFEMFEGLKDCGLTMRVVPNLIRTGLLGMDGSRSRLVLECQVYNKLTDREKRNFHVLGEKYDFDLLNMIAQIHSEEVLGDNGKILIPEKRMGTIKKNVQGYKDVFFQNRKYDSFSNWFFEKNILGYSYSQKLKDTFKGEDADTFVNLDLIPDLPAESQAKSVGQVLEVRVNTSARGNKYMRMEISDDFGIQTFMFGNTRNSNKLDEFLEINGEIKEGDILVLTGSKFGDIIQCDNLRVIRIPVGFKLKNNDKS